MTSVFFMFVFVLMHLAKKHFVVLLDVSLKSSFISSFFKYKPKFKPPLPLFIRLPKTL